MMHDSLINKFPYVSIVAMLDESCLLLMMLLVKINCLEPELPSQIQPYPPLALLLTIDVYMMEHVYKSVVEAG